MVLDVTGPVANRYAMLLVCDSGAEYFAPTLVVGVGGDGSGCEQGRCGCWFAIRAKYFSPARWLVVLGLTGRVANRYAVVMVCDSGEECFAHTLIGGVGAYGSGCVQVCGGDGLRYGRKMFRPYIGCWWG